MSAQQAVRLRSLQALIAELQAALAELEEAEELLRRTSGGRAYIGFAGGLYIEASKEEALEYVERRKRALRALLEKLQEEARRAQAQRV